jgi:hypothetical protein
VCFLDQGLGDFALDTGQADVEARAEEVTAVRQVQVIFRVDTFPVWGMVLWGVVRSMSSWVIAHS